MGREAFLGEEEEEENSLWLERFGEGREKEKVDRVDFMKEQGKEVGSKKGRTGKGRKRWPREEIEKKMGEMRDSKKKGKRQEKNE